MTERERAAGRISPETVRAMALAAGHGTPEPRPEVLARVLTALRDLPARVVEPADPDDAPTRPDPAVPLPRRRA